jgi:pimeloyl-ACP methyl ester carboxylesterase
MPEAAPEIGLTVMRGALRVLSRTAPRVATRIAADLFMKPRRFRTPPREEALLEGAERLRILAGERTVIRAWRWGSGPVVILAHGWEGRGSQMAPFVAPLVAAGRTVIAFDAPGHGTSNGNRSSLPHFAWALRSVAAAVSDNAPDAIIAHSLGCAATTLALREGLTAGRVVFISPPLNPADYTNRFGDILGLEAEIIDRMRMRIEERFLRKWSDYSLAETARTMTAPLLVIHDRDDQDTLWSEGAALAGAWPGARMMSTEGLGHRRILREPSVIEAAAEFVSTGSCN